MVLIANGRGFRMVKVSVQENDMVRNHDRQPTGNQYLVETPFSCGLSPGSSPLSFYISLPLYICVYVCLYVRKSQSLNICSVLKLLTYVYVPSDTAGVVPPHICLCSFRHSRSHASSHMSLILPTQQESCVEELAKLGV